MTVPIPPNAEGAPRTGWSLMPDGLIACFTTKPGHREAVIDELDRIAV